MRRVVVGLLMFIAGILLVLGIIGGTMPKDEITLSQIIDKVKQSSIISMLKEYDYSISFKEENNKFIFVINNDEYVVTYQNKMLSTTIQNKEFDLIFVSILYDAVGQLYGHDEFDSYNIFKTSDIYNYTLANEGLVVTTTYFKMDVLKETKIDYKISKEQIIQEVKEKLSIKEKETTEMKVNHFIDETLEYLNLLATSSVNYPTKINLEELPVENKPSSCEKISGIPTFNFTNCLFDNEYYSYEEGTLVKVINPNN